jgi:hypothetical protein
MNQYEPEEKCTRDNFPLLKTKENPQKIRVLPL